MKGKMTALINGIIVTQNAVLNNNAILLRNEVIEDIVDLDKLFHHYRDIEIVDCSGHYILPGLIDVHSDMIEGIIVPRKGLSFDYSIALYEADRQLIGQGITTIYHSISIANSTICNRKRTLSVAEMIGIGDAICRFDADLLIHHRFHARLELNTVEAFPAICQRVKQGKIHELSLMNHTPGQGQYASLDSFKMEIKKQYGEVSEERMNEIIRECQAKPLLSCSQISELLKYASTQNIPTAFHDLETVEQLSFMMENNIHIGEFPLNIDIAAKASALGVFNLVGAPNILKGKSHNNNASATELLKSGLANIICSDYYSPALLLSIFEMIKNTHLTLPEVVSYATLFPAKAVGIDNKYGSIEPGKNADIIVVNISKSIPKVVLTFVDGVLKHRLHYGEII